MIDAGIVLVLALFAFGLSFGVTHSFPSAIGLTALLALAIGGLIAWIKRHPVKWRGRTRAWVALTTSLYFAGIGVLSIAVQREAWPTGVLCLTTAALFAV